MIATALIAASVLAPAGVTAGIQADPVCLPVTAQQGHSYPLTVYVSGSEPLTLAVTPAHGSLERSLHQVPASWVNFAANPAGSGTVALTLNVAPDAAPGAYWSDITATAGSPAQSGAGAQADLGAAAATAIVFTVGPSVTPPPPCDALTLAQSTGRFPPWPAKAFATTSWAQVFAEENQEARSDPDNSSPTATSAASGAHAQTPGARTAGPAAAPGAPASPAPAYSPAAGTSAGSGATGLSGWAILGGLVLAALAARRNRRKP